jgi:hypothetical protein
MTNEHFGPHGDVAQKLMEGLAKGSPEEVRALFSGPADIDDPFAGRQIDGGFERLVRNWGPAKLAQIKSIHLDHVTVGAQERFVGAEFSLLLEKSGVEKRLNALAVLEMAGHKVLKSRLYYRRARLDGVQHVRNRILDEPQHIERFFPMLEEYQRALSAGDAEAQAATFAEDGVFDGHGEHQDLTKGLGMGVYKGRAAVREVLIQMFGIIGAHAGSANAGANLEKLNLFADQRTAILEFNIIEPNHPTNRVQAGAAAYEMDSSGKLKEARVYDEAW